MSESKYTGNKTKNHFTAYLQTFIRGKRMQYLKKKEIIRKMEQPLDNLYTDHGIALDEMHEIIYKENLLLKESRGDYPEWNELSDQNLINSLMLLNEEERKVIYQHVFEERTFKEISLLNGVPDEKVKNIYYYAIPKIRKWMGGDR